MKNRVRQRENRRKYSGNAAVTSGTGRPKVVEKLWQNSEGYRDPTAYHGIRNAKRRSAVHN